jgi:DNA helicase-2/ATP-dependent DNA helicase PcrA
VEEERRLLYVGLTRAREHLSISWSLSRNPGGRRTRKPSRFLAGLAPETASSPTAGGGRARGKAARCRACGRPLSNAAERKVGRCADCPATYDEDLFARLKEWRLSRATEDQVPAYVVFTDKTLEAIAEAKPGSPAELQEISGIGPAKIERYGEALLALLD